MEKYNIAGLLVEMEPKFPLLSQRAHMYSVDTADKADFSIDIPLAAISAKSKNTPGMSEEACEYAWYGYEFYKRLLRFDGMMLHSSCIAVDGQAYLFSASSGTGKSTHTSLWKEHFGDRAVYVNDDKPALRFMDGKVCACGTPFSGKTSLNSNIIVPVKGICLLNRGVENSIRVADRVSAVPKLFNQSYRPQDPELMDLALGILGRVLESVPVYELFCNISDDAVLTSYQFMSR
ncbi:MAG: hypothetical protein E7656_00770 [Ruminococcaceae bacterium]|nr:hypothetical protein [Oscillospiraceae bacterium]